MRPWPVLLLFSCTRPNPLFLDDQGGGSTVMSLGTGSSGADESTTGVDPTTSSATTGDQGSSSSTTGRPACEGFPDERLLVDPPLTEPQCLAVSTYFGRVNKPDQAATITLCLDEKCTLCSFDAPLDDSLAPFVADGACLKLVHQGEWRPGDPEAPSGCKTTAVALYDDASVYPLYAGSSRVVAAPSFLDSDVRMDVEPGARDRCDCAPADCCPEGQAARLTLQFGADGVAFGEIGAGEFFDAELKGVPYVVGVLRAHLKGYVSTATQACVVEPETRYVDWHMLRLAAP